MKKIYLIAFIALAFASCKKNDQLPGDGGCITRIKRQNFNIKSSDSVSAIQLLKQNNIPYNDIQLEYFSSYDVPTSDVNAGTYQSVFVIQQINGLPVLSGEIWYQFKNNVLQATSGVRYGAINLSTSSALQLTQLRAAYIAEVNKHNSTLATGLKDSCLVAQFGYYDLNDNVNSTPNFVKAWWVAPKNASYPQAVFQDGSGKTINYNSGIILF
ncbi:hypothetical protein ACPPVU_02165 [Mucilaginibacter sp. McL0603]|uniref:hypothetical protein n=1 Tax=Mucilaginibacter sp. McL0603 TaxID=3415670 RepID=UPI003CFA5E00